MKRGLSQKRPMKLRELLENTIITGYNKLENPEEMNKHL
jgi:hypothetical protein